MVRTSELSSSPDPLGSTQENLGTVPSSKHSSEKSSATPKKPLADTSGNARQQDLNQTTPPSQRTGDDSPFKFVALANRSASPWRIRVTIEAEQEDDKHGQSSRSIFPVKRLAERMTTTMVPLKDADEKLHPVSQKGRGRSRKSIDSQEKKHATPKQKSAKSHTTESGSAKSPSNETDHRTSSPSKRGRGRSAKSTKVFAEDLELQHGEGYSLVDRVGVKHPKSPRTTRTSRSRRQGLGKVILPTKSALPYDPVGSVSERVHDEQGLDVGSSVIADVDDKLESHSHPSDPTDEHEDFDSILESEGFSMVSVSSLPSAKLHSSSQHKPHIDDKNTSSPGNPPGLVPNFPTDTTLNLPILCSENTFEEDREPCAQNASSIPSHSASARFPEPVVGQTPFIMSPTTRSPPILESSVKRKAPRALDKTGDGTPKLVRVVRAGIALQGMLSAQNIRTRSGITAQDETGSSFSPAKPPIERLDDLFSGFGAGTRRELRAGLRLGEELAKRHHIVSQANPKYKSDDDVFGREDMQGSPKSPSRIGDEEYHLKLPDSSQNTLYPVIANTQLPSPARSEHDSDYDRMSWKVDTPNFLQATNVQAELQTRDKGVGVREDDNLEGSTMAREEEEYRLEREAVIKQIQAANSSQVMIINSDSEDEYDHDEEDDIWQEQVHSSAFVPEPVYDISTALLPKHDPQPRRSQLPSPWRRQGKTTSASRVSTNDSDSFWQPSRFVDGPDRSKKLPAEKNEDSGPQKSPSTICLQGLRVCHYDSTFEPDSVLHTSPTQRNVQAGQKICRAEKQELPVSRDPDEEEYDETLERSIEGTIEIEDQLAQASSKDMYPSDSRAAQKASIGGKIGQRDTVGFVPHRRVPVAASTSWLGYLASFIPAWGEATVAVPHRLPNSKSKLPRSGSLEGPLSLYMPWTAAHYDALYFHYAASKEGRKRYTFNAKSASARYLGRIVRYRGWEKPVTEEDLAIVDAFMVNLKARGTSENAQGGWKIDERVAVLKTFTLWHGGVQRGECEAGIGKIGLAESSEEMWRPDMESWYHDKE
ncbi:hypothetical protein MMC07_000671 [Pseudocyphellaria aurata]|nr:hypothetical protein [Pseudocyphellaria aurata]